MPCSNVSPINHEEGSIHINIERKATSLPSIKIRTDISCPESLGQVLRPSPARQPVPAPRPSTPSTSMSGLTGDRSLAPIDCGSCSRAPSPPPLQRRASLRFEVHPHQESLSGHAHLLLAACISYMRLADSCFRDLPLHVLLWLARLILCFRRCRWDGSSSKALVDLSFRGTDVCVVY